MNTFSKLATGLALGVMTIPAAATAAETPDTTAQTNGAKVCKTMQGTTPASRAAFTLLIASQNPGTKVTSSNAFGKCVSAAAKKDATQAKQAKNAARAACRAKADAVGAKPNAFGKCVSAAAKAEKADADATEMTEARATASAAKTCKAEQDKPATFAAKYGTNANAFGKCVSAKSKAAAAA